MDEVLRLVKAFQFTDKNGEVCPANWSPGSKTVKQIFTFRVTDPSSAKPLNQIDLHRYVDKTSTTPNNHHNNNSTTVVNNATASTKMAPSSTTATSTANVTTTSTTKVIQNNTSNNNDKNIKHHYNHSVHPDKKGENGNSQKIKNKIPSKASGDQQQLVHCKVCNIY